MVSAGRAEPPRVLLLSMPFGALGRPALGLSLLQASLRAMSVPGDVRYLTFPFAELIGHDEYQWVSFELPYTAFAGDWTFTGQLYGERPEADSAYVEQVLRRKWMMSDTTIRRILRVRSLSGPFLDHCMAAVPWHKYDIVGFTSTFEQNIASLALARRIKAAHPKIAVVFGGANWEGEMGLELHRLFNDVDYVCPGEADESFPALVSWLRGRRELRRRQTPSNMPLGVIYRREGNSVLSGARPLLSDLDLLPVPDYADYFKDLDQSTLCASVLPTLLIETSRGCWWGAKSHCTFCGLNGGAMAFRRKTAHRALTELHLLVARWQTDSVEAVDNILDMRYFKDFLPALAASSRPPRLFYEVKANLSRNQVALLRAAGVDRVQPGIESLSDHVLGLMRKGTTALRNIQLLKWCKEFGITAEWNLLYGFPGETAEDYTAMLRLLSQITFLGPPSGHGPIRLDRFSPYHATPKEYGFVNVRPLLPYQFLYPFEQESLFRIAYYFEHDYAPEADPSGFADEVVSFVQRWQKEPERGTLSATVLGDESLLLLDTRGGNVTTTMLSGLERAAYEYCDQLRSVQSVTAYLRRSLPSSAIATEAVTKFLSSVVAAGLMVTDGAHYLSLALRAPLPGKPVRLKEPLRESRSDTYTSSDLEPVLQMT
jgi:ribosomal peptide maturation radical SAM protein 1